MVPVRDPAAHASYGVVLPIVRDGYRTIVDEEQEALPDQEHSSRVQRLPSYAVLVHVL